MGRAALSAKGSGGDRVLRRPGGGAGAARWAPRAACCREESREKRVPVCVCIHGCDVCIRVWPTHVRMSVCPTYMCVCGCIHVHSVCMCACAVCVYVCAHVYVYGICVCVFVRVHKHAPARVVCVSVHACVCGGEARRGEAAAPAQSLPRAAALPGSRDAGRGPPPTPGSSPASRAVRLFPLSPHGSASWRSGGKGGVE